MVAPDCMFRLCMPQIKPSFTTGCIHGMHASAAALSTQLMAWEPNRLGEHATEKIDEKTTYAWMRSALVVVTTCIGCRIMYAVNGTGA